MNKENWEKVLLPRAYGHESPNLFVGINGKNYLLPKGKESLVPPEVAKELRRAMAAQEMQETSADRLAKA